MLFKAFGLISSVFTTIVAKSDDDSVSTISGIITIAVIVIFVASEMIYNKLKDYKSTEQHKIEQMNSDLNYNKNSARLINICEELIEKYQTNSCKPSCKSDLLELIKPRVSKAKAEIINWNSNTDYIKIAHTLLAHATFDLLASGKYHIYRGMLNPMSCAENLMDVYKASMEYGIKTGLLDEKSRKEQYEYLLECISEVG